MDSEGHIGTFEAICTTTLVMTNKLFFTSLGVLVDKTGTAAWYTAIISGLTAFVFFLFIYALLKRFPGKDLPQVYEIVLGKVVGKTVVLLFCAFAFYYSGSTLREFVEMIKTYNLPFTPTSVIMAAFLIVTVIIAYFGFENIGRICAICFIPTIVAFSLILLLASPSYNINMIKPYGGHGIKTTLITGFLRSSAYVEFSILATVISGIQGYKNYKKVGGISILLTVVISSLSFLLYLMAFGYSAGRENIAGIFELSRSIYFNRFFQRVESIFLFIWVTSSVIATTVSFYMGILIYCKVFKIRNHKPLLLPFAFLTYIVAIFPISLQEVMQINLTLLRQYSMFVIYIPSVIVLIISLVLKKKGERTNV